jgi:hypothetical protein
LNDPSNNRSAHPAPRAFPGKDMSMNVIHLLSPARSRVDNCAETGITAGVRHAQFAGKPCRQAQHSTKQRRISFGAARQRLNMFTRDHQHMDGRGRVDIVKSNKLIVFMDLLGISPAAILQKMQFSWLMCVAGYPDMNAG